MISLVWGGRFRDWGRGENGGYIYLCVHVTLSHFLYVFTSYFLCFDLLLLIFQFFQFFCLYGGCSDITSPS